jgi:DNA-3-methyladenine glycosylase I
MLVLESFQAGLAWITILKKRENFKEAFDDFDVEKVANYDEAKIEELLNNAGIIRHKGKINAAINNANVFIEIQKEYGSFSDYIWQFTDNNVLIDTEENYLTNSPLSDKIAKDLKKRGMKFVGTTIIYSYLESIGIINNHIHECFRYGELK